MPNHARNSNIKIYKRNNKNNSFVVRKRAELRYGGGGGCMFYSMRRSGETGAVVLHSVGNTGHGGGIKVSYCACG